MFEAEISRTEDIRAYGGGDLKAKQLAAGVERVQPQSAARVTSGFQTQRRLHIGCLVVSLAFSLHPAAGGEPRPLVAGKPIRLPLIEGKEIRFTHLSTEQGLSQSRVDHMLQDRRGFIWIGTYNGLNRYDGYRFKIYKPDAEQPEQLGRPVRLRSIRGPVRDPVDRNRPGAEPIRPRRPRGSPTFAPIPTIPMASPVTRKI